MKLVLALLAGKLQQKNQRLPTRNGTNISLISWLATAETSKIVSY